VASPSWTGPDGLQASGIPVGLGGGVLQTSGVLVGLGVGCLQSSGVLVGLVQLAANQWPKQRLGVAQQGGDMSPALSSSWPGPVSPSGQQHQTGTRRHPGASCGTTPGVWHSPPVPWMPASGDMHVCFSPA